MEANLDRLAQLEQHHISAAYSTICRRVTIRSEPSSLMANYSKIKRVELLQCCIAMAVKGNWNLKEWESIEKVERGTEKLRREAAGRLDEDNVLESKAIRNPHLCLGPARGSRPDHWVKKDSQSRTRRVESNHLVFRRSAVSSLWPCYVWEFGGFLCLTFFVVSLLCNHNKIL